MCTATGQLARAMEAGQAAVLELPARQTAWARLRAVGAGYLGYAQDEPDLFRTAFTTPDEPTDDDDATGDGGLTPFGPNAALDDLVAVGVLPAARRPNAEPLAWSVVHGLSMLLIDGPLKHLERRQADAAGQQLLDTSRPGCARAPAGRAAVRRSRGPG